MINFPNSPTVNQEFTEAGKTWKWDGAVWNFVSISAITTEPWIRPAGWLPLPEVTETSELFCGLVAIGDHDSNTAWLEVAGDIIVDWGDGITENLPAGLISHTYNYSNSALTNTYTALGYKQALITITPQLANSLTYVSLQSDAATTEVSWLDIVLAAPNLESVQFGINYDDYSKYWNHPTLQSVKIVSTTLVNGVSVFQDLFGMRYLEFYCPAVTTLERFCQNCKSLSHVIITGTSNVVSVNNAFYNCEVLVVAPLIDTSNVTDFSYMFGDCTLLASVPMYDTSSGQDFSQMFAYCESLQAIPPFNLSTASTVEGMFADCTVLRNVPAFDTANVTIFDRMFGWCHSIEKIPDLDTSSGTSFSSMFTSCWSLRNAPQLDTSLGIEFNQMFSNCKSLISIPAYNTSNGAEFGSVFSDCTALKQIPDWDFSGATNLAFAFSNCSSIQQSPTLVLDTGVDLAGIFYSCINLSKLNVSNWPPPIYSYSYEYVVYNCRLSANSLNTLYTDLPTVSGGTYLLGVGENYGINDLTHDPSIAVSKGWTVIY
jgi:hypothetical protein